MNEVELFIILVLKSVYTTLPAIAANVAPIITQYVPILQYPLDCKICIKGERLLGDHKTFRGLLSGVVFSLAIITIQYIIFRLTGVNLALYDYKEINFVLLGFLMGFGVIIGDAVKSFIKRRFRVPPGESFIPWDQIDCVLGGLLFGRIAWNFDMSYALIIIFLTFFLHILIRHIAYYIGLCDSKW